MVELLITSYMHAGRQLVLHLQCLWKILPLIFASDQINYAWYETYYVCMKSLEKTHPQIYEHLVNRHFGVQMSQVNSFGNIPEDQTIDETIKKTHWQWDCRER